MADQEQSQKSYLPKFLHSVYSFMVAISVILAVGFTVYQLIDSRIEQAINDEQFIRRVSSHVRPYVIFDVNSSILVDGGATQYLEKIEVEKGTKNASLMPVKIVQAVCELVLPWVSEPVPTSALRR